MPTSPSSSIDSPAPYATASAPEALPALAPLKWRRPALLFAATLFSIPYTYALNDGDSDTSVRIAHGAIFAVSLLAILLTHEFAHFLFARRHRVNASLPYFIPMPIIAPWGTMGAVIVMRDRIRSRNALLDIGASGPLAGLFVAIPMLLYGLAHSEVHPLTPTGMQEGQSIVYWLMKRVALGRIPDGSDVYLSGTTGGAMAFAGWVGLLVTMLNLLPVGQLDGGHIAYALFGPRQNTYSKIVRFSLLALVPIIFLWRMIPALSGVPAHDLWPSAALASTSWIGWFLILTVLERLSGGGHPPTEAGELSPFRRVIAMASLVLFVLLFMPTPLMKTSDTSEYRNSPAQISRP